MGKTITYDAEIETYICLLGEILYRRRTYEYKNKPWIIYWTNECKNCIMKKICCKKKNYKTIQDYGNPSKIWIQRKMETNWAQKIYKKWLKTIELLFTHMKQNIKLHEFTTIGIKNTNTEFKLYTIVHNLKRIYNEINIKKQLKIRKIYKKSKNTKIN